MRRFPAWDPETAQAIINEHRALPGAMLPILNALQDHFGYIDREAVALVAKALNVTRAEVHGVVSFYHDYRETPPGHHVLKVCRAEACQSMGAEQVIGHIKRRLGIDFHETTADGSVTLEPVFCLGNCACSPSLFFDERIVGRVDEAVIDRLLDEMEATP